MSFLKVDEGETIDRNLKRFRTRCEKAGLFKELKKRKHFIKPSERRRAEKMKARKKALKKLRDQRRRMRDY